jgi:Fur family transcriptional regulator, peroxide stress response regulator
MQELARIVDSLRSQGFRVTPQRVAIVEYMMNTDSHPSAEDLYNAIKKKYPMVSLATVYKTLELLVKMGVVKELSFPDGARYDANAATHINLVCLNCGKIEDTSDERSLKELESNIAKRSKYQILGRRFELYGYCSQCQSKMTTS